MQRAPCSWSSFTGRLSWYSSKSCTRCATGRFDPSTRSMRRKPPSSPIATPRGQPRNARLLVVVVALVRGRASVEVAHVVRRLGRLLGERAAVVGGHDLHPRADQPLPLGQHVRGRGAPGPVAVLLHERADLLEVLGARGLQLDQLGVTSVLELAV